MLVLKELRAKKSGGKILIDLERLRRHLERKKRRCRRGSFLR